MTNILPFPGRIDAIDRQPASVEATLAGALGDLSRIVGLFQKTAFSSVVAALGDLEYGAIQLRRAARLVDEDPLRGILDAEILKIEKLVDDARKSLPGLL
jgi:hypothetical protein